MRASLASVLLFISFLPAPAAAQDSAALAVATKEAAPFSFRGEDGEWEGISIELWEAVADQLDLDYEFREASLEDLIGGLVDGRFDASVAALTVTSEREQRVDFSHPFHPSGLGIAVPVEDSVGIFSAVKRLLSVRFFQAVGTLFAILFLGGAVLWMLERKKNPEQFGGSTARGLGAAFWWSAVTMTTVGYGDKAPVTGGGRLVAVVWMFASVIMISGLTATIASTLTVSQLESSISGPDDLGSAGRIACVAGSTGEAYLRGHGLSRTSFASAAEGMQALVNGEVGAFVYDAPILRYLAHDDDRVTTLPVTFERQDYALALPLGSELRKPINAALLEVTSDSDWPLVLDRYLGTGR